MIWTENQISVIFDHEIETTSQKEGKMLRHLLIMWLKAHTHKISGKEF